MVIDYKKIEEEKKQAEEQVRKKMQEAGIMGILNLEVKKFGKSAHIIIPKQFLGKKAVVLIRDETKIKGNKETPQNDKK